MAGHGLGNTLAALKAGGEQLRGVGPIGGRTRRAPGLSAGAARLEQHPVRLLLGVVHRPDLTGPPVGVLDAAGEADRVVAVAGLGDQLHPAVKALAGPVHDLAQDAEELGASLRWATATTTRTTKS